MKPLLLQNFRHLLRSKFVVLYLLLATFIQYVILKAAVAVQININMTQASIGPSEAVAIVLAVQAFLGGYFALLYGVSFAPYLHQGARSPLMHVLPIPKWLFPLSSMVVFACVVLLQTGVLTGLLAMQFPLDEIPWSRFFRGAFHEFLSLEGLMLFVAGLSMAVGRLPTFLLTLFSIFCLQGLGTYLKFREALGGAEEGSVTRVLEIVFPYLPPFGGSFYDTNPVAWAVWIPIFFVLFTRTISRPKLGRASEE